MVDYYESMRAYVNAQNKTGALPMGLDLFMKHGMKRWVDAWHSTTILKTATKDIVERTTVLIPDAVVTDIVVLISRMLLGTKEVKKVCGQL